jgi:exodeoxyribonuclease V alpha subunit
MMLEKKKKIVEFECEVEKVVYKSDNFKVYGVKVDKEKYPQIKHNAYNNVSIVGDLHDLALEVVYKVKAYEDFSKGKMSYKVVNIKRDVPTSTATTKAFLKEILTEQQADTLLEVYPDILDRVMSNNLSDIDLNLTKGIKEKTFEKIQKRIIENFALVDVIEQFGGYVTMTMLKKLNEKYTSIEQLKSKFSQEPYDCLCEISGVGFKTADTIILSMNENKENDENIKIYFDFDILTSKQRGKACVDYILKQNEANGNTRMDIVTLREEYEGLVPECGDHFVDIIKTSNSIIYDALTKMVSLVVTWNAEKYIANKIKQAMNDITNVWEGIDVRKYAFDGKINLTEEQIKGLDALVTQNMFILTAGAGMGKTATTKSMIDLLKDNRKTFTLMSPTGRASKILSEYTQEEASTIHRGLGFRPPNKWLHGEDLPLHSDVVIVDEFSMVDIFLFEKLLKAIDFNKTKLIMIGDMYQLSSVSAGNCLHDLINSNVVPIVRLSKVFRYGVGGQMTVATDVRNSKVFMKSNMEKTMILGEDQSYIAIPCDKQSMLRNVETIYTKLIKEKKYNPIDVCILSGYNKGELGTYEINKLIRPIANDITTKEHYQVGENVYYMDDLVLQTVNNYKAEIYNFEESKDDTKENFNKNPQILIANGEIGKIIAILKDGFVIDFDGKFIKYNNEQILGLKLAYSISIHKMQGSSCKVVILLTPSSHTYMTTSNLMYVGVTRATDRVIHLCNPKSVNIGIRKKDNYERETNLKYFLRSK